MLALAVAGAASCDDTPTSPSAPAVATFRVGSETFRVLLTTDEQVEAAEAAQNGGPARIPNGRIVAGTDVNTGWTWHLEEVEFAEVTAEVCDGLPSDVEKLGTAFDSGRFCPWDAQVIEIEPVS